jgi:hypothetical protein
MVEPVHSLFSEDSDNFATNKHYRILSISHAKNLVADWTELFYWEYFH